MAYEDQFPKYGKEFHYQGVQQILENLTPRPDPGISAKPVEVKTGADTPDEDDDDQTT